MIAAVTAGRVAHVESKTAEGHGPVAAWRRPRHVNRWLDIAAAALLAVAALATSWSTYQAELWSGVQAAKYTLAGVLQVESTRASTTAGQQQGVDVGAFMSWLNAYAVGNTELATFYQRRFRPEFAPAFDAWVKSEPRRNRQAAPSPFALPEYRLAENERAMKLDAEATRTLREGQAANQHSDAYVRNTVLLASVMFLTGMAQPARWMPVRVGMMAVAVLMCVIALYNIATYRVA